MTLKLYKKTIIFFAILLVNLTYSNSFKIEVLEKNGIKIIFNSNIYPKYDQETIKHTLNLLLEKPENLLSKIKEKINTYEDIKDKIDPKLCYQETENNPLSFLGECIASNCPLNRLEFDHRKKFEQKALELIEKNYPDKSTSLVYTVFASSGLFSDCVILTHLVKKGYKNFKICIIDLKFQEYIEKLIDLNKKNNEIPLNINDTNPEKQTWLRINTFRLIQLITWLQNITNNQNLNIELFLFDSKDSYLNLITKDDSFKSDILISEDYFESEIPGSENSIYDLRKLMYFATKPNSLIFSLFQIFTMIGNLSIEEIYKKKDDLTAQDKSDIEQKFENDISFFFKYHEEYLKYKNEIWSGNPLKLIKPFSKEKDLSYDKNHFELISLEFIPLNLNRFHMSKITVSIAIGATISTAILGSIFFLWKLLKYKK